MEQRNEWHEYENKIRRDCVSFYVPEEQFAFTDHKDVFNIKMTDKHRGFIVLRSRRRRSFFARILPDASKFFVLRKHRLPPTASPMPWCVKLKPIDN